MPRERSFSIREITLRAMNYFWKHGYHGSSVSDLVNATQVSRHGFYSAFEGKHDLFLACLELYQDEVVTPAFASVENAAAGLEEIANYFESQIARAESHGLPGPGCLVVNTFTEVAPHQPDVYAAAERHNLRLKQGFTNALRNSSNGSLGKREVSEMASFLVISAQGLWSMSRGVTKARTLRQYASTLVNLIQYRLEI